MAARDVEDGAKELGRKLKGGAKKMAVRPAPRPPPPPRAPPRPEGVVPGSKQTLDSRPGAAPQPKAGRPAVLVALAAAGNPARPTPPPPPRGGAPPPPRMLCVRGETTRSINDATDGRLVAPCTNARIGGPGPPEGAE